MIMKADGKRLAGLEEGEQAACPGPDNLIFGYVVRSVMFHLFFSVFLPTF